MVAGPRAATTLIATIKPLPPRETQPFVVTASACLREHYHAWETDRDKAGLGGESAAFEEKQKLVVSVRRDRWSMS
jgi:hypothetical protein